MYSCTLVLFFSTSCPGRGNKLWGETPSSFPEKQCPVRTSRISKKDPRTSHQYLPPPRRTSLYHVQNISATNPASLRFVESPLWNRSAIRCLD
ncbi:hypothetical protein K474DRAFT_980011 [Panus rudis PR-1116 ss-1]|nr:hypothetical protein K474DRAFT_980011 [Panus rudis PR-1116 ss-1]